MLGLVYMEIWASSAMKMQLEMLRRCIFKRRLKN